MASWSAAGSHGFRVPSSDLISCASARLALSPASFASTAARVSLEEFIRLGDLRALKTGAPARVRGVWRAVSAFCAKSEFVNPLCLPVSPRSSLLLMRVVLLVSRVV